MKTEQLLTRAKFRVKIKSLAVEATIIRQEAAKTRDREAKNQLYLHRVGILRREARSAQLAYALWRQKPYMLVERQASVGVDRQRVKEILKSLAGLVVSVTEISSWMSCQTILPRSSDSGCSWPAS